MPDDAGAQRIKDAIAKYGPIQDRWVIRLGKEDGEFEPWKFGPEDFAKDYEGFVACLNLSNIVDCVEERMADKKKWLKKERKLANDIRKAQEKAQAKLDKVAAKLVEKQRKAAEKVQVKAAAKAERDRLMAELKAAKEKNPVAFQEALVNAEADCRLAGLPKPEWEVDLATRKQ